MRAEFKIGDAVQFPVFRMSNGDDFISIAKKDNEGNLLIEGPTYNTWTDHWSGLVANVDDIHVTVWYLDRQDGNLKARVFLEHQLNKREHLWLQDSK